STFGRCPPFPPPPRIAPVHVLTVRGDPRASRTLSGGSSAASKYAARCPCSTRHRHAREFPKHSDPGETMKLAIACRARARCTSERLAATGFVIDDAAGLGESALSIPCTRQPESQPVCRR